MPQRMERMLASLAANLRGMANAPPLLAGTGEDATHLLVVATLRSRPCRRLQRHHPARRAGASSASCRREGKTVKLLTVGRKGRDCLRRDLSRLIVESLTDVGRPRAHLRDGAGDRRAARCALFAAGEFDVCHHHLQPLPLGDDADRDASSSSSPSPPPAERAEPPATSGGAIYEFEPDEEDILGSLLPRNLAMQIFTALLENAASEQGARMTAMDNATRNAGDMIKQLTMNYNRARQANITKELIEIISGAEAALDNEDASSMARTLSAPSPR